MFSFIKGNVEILKENFVVLENSGIGYKIYINSRLYNYFQKNKIDIKIYTFTNIKENDISLYGFLSFEELELFEKLITVSGVGPKGAIALLNIMTVEELILAIISSDIKALSKGQGIGQKMAQRIVLELKDKVDIKEVLDTNEESVYINYEAEVIEALSSLGFTRSEILKALKDIEDKHMPIEKMISLCLKKLSS